MELNRAQLLVHNDEAMKRPHPSWLINQAGIRFLISPLLKKVMACFCLTFMRVSVNFVRTVLMVDTLMQTLDKPFSVEVLGNSELGMTTFGHSQGTTCICLIISTIGSNAIPTIAMRLSELPTTGKNLRMCPHSSCQASQCEAFSLERSSSEISAHQLASRVQGCEEGFTSSSSSYTSLNPIDSEEEEGDEAGRQARFVDVELWKPEFSACKLGKQVTEVNSTQNHDTSVDLRQAVMLPNDIPTLAEETSETIRSLLVMQQFRQFRVRAEEGQARVADRVFTKGANWARDNYSRQVTKVRSKSFLEGWLTCMAELIVLKDNPAWTKAALAPEFPEPPTPYSPMILPSFNEEYMNRPDEDEDVLEPVVAPVVAPTNEAANLAEETGGMVAKESREKFTEEIGGRCWGRCSLGSPSRALMSRLGALVKFGWSFPKSLPSILRKDYSRLSSASLRARLNPHQISSKVFSEKAYGTRVQSSTRARLTLHQISGKAFSNNGCGTRFGALAELS
ncbi:hypothetical protein Acr_00g0072800 [Actinidia rufa]|uniref:Uncharacterized protein n=1 Tax=Actinidia rufa TaxID=165716 RepID=A0A7J0DRX3_9ERIC|nr:hypothetical protein Acr_00g0072800 [Actinidia rufa]